MASLITVEGVRKNLGGVNILDDVGFPVERGRTLAVMGTSGTGKSTLLKIMIGALRPDAGKITIDGDDITVIEGKPLDRVRRKFGVLFQSAALLNSLTVGENVSLPLRYHGEQLAEETIDIIVTVKLRAVALLHRKDAMPEELSGGEKKRAGLARALALDPVVLFYDEPTSGLDPVATGTIDDLINDLKTKGGITSIVITHDIESARRIADEIILLHGGKIYFRGTRDEFFHSPDEGVRQFIEGRPKGPLVLAGGHEDDYLRMLLEQDLARI